jgi:hypothetical protein
VVRVFGDQHLRQQARRGDALVDDVRGHRRLNQRLALRANPLAADVALHGEHARFVVQLLGHVLTDALQLAAADAARAVRLVVDLAARTVLGKRLALRS